jgi:phosphotransferase system HPr (HPr) family protein
MLTKTITSTTDLYARKAVSLSSKISEFNSVSVYFESDESRHVNAKSILGVLSAGCRKGTKLTFTFDARDNTALEEDACMAVENWFSENAGDMYV